MIRRELGWLESLNLRVRPTRESGVPAYERESVIAVA